VEYQKIKANYAILTSREKKNKKDVSHYTVYKEWTDSVAE